MLCYISRKALVFNILPKLEPRNWIRYKLQRPAVYLLMNLILSPKLNWCVGLDIIYSLILHHWVYIVEYIFPSPLTIDIQYIPPPSTLCTTSLLEFISSNKRTSKRLNRSDRFGTSHDQRIYRCMNGQDLKILL